MHGGYTCSYIHNSGKVCNRSRLRSEGCFLHWKAKKRVPCAICEKPTASSSGRCQDHIGGFYVAQHYQRLREKAISFLLLFIELSIRSSSYFFGFIFLYSLPTALSATGSPCLPLDTTRFGF